MKSIQSLLPIFLLLLFVACEKNDPQIFSNQNSITSFKIADKEATINNTDKTITIQLPYDADVKALKPEITVSDKATISPQSGKEVDFTNPVNYTVTAENGTKQDYKVTALILSNKTNITSFKVSDQGTIINNADKTITIQLPYQADVKALKPEITVSDKATISPKSGEEVDFTNPVTYTVTAENGDKQDYTVTATTNELIVTMTGTLPIMDRFDYGKEKPLTIKLHFVGKITIDFGDGTVEEIKPSYNNEVSHSYQTGTSYHVKIYGTTESITHLSCDNNQLTTLDISKNIRMEGLYCRDNQLTTLDVSNNINMTGLHCRNNQLTTLSKNINMIYLDCDNNQLTTLDVSKNTNMIYLNCGQNQLTTLDVSKNIKMTELSCNKNQLQTLDISNNINMEELNCRENQLQTLDVSKNIKMTSLSCGNNQLTTLDVSKNINITALDCGSNQLTTLDVSKNIKITDLECSYNKLQTLDVSNHIDMKYLVCVNNKLQTLILRKNHTYDRLAHGENPGVQIVYQ